MPFIASTADGASLYYREYRPSKEHPFEPTSTRSATKPTLVFTSAWPFSSKMYDHPMLPLCESYGFRCIAIDRRGFGRSEWSGNQDVDYDTFAGDLRDVMDRCGVEGGFIGIGASLGCGEFFLALKKFSALASACRGLVFLGPSLPVPMQTSRKSAGPPRAFWDSLLTDLREDRWRRLRTALSYVWGEAGEAMLSAEEKMRYEAMAVEADPFALERTVQIFLGRDFTDLIQDKGPSFAFPLLILHGGADAANPVEAGPGLLREYVPDTTVKIYDDAAHGERNRTLLICG